jgi:hypothetical protein
MEFEPKVETRGEEARFNLGLENATPLVLGAARVRFCITLVYPTIMAPR